MTDLSFLVKRFHLKCHLCEQISGSMVMLHAFITSFPVFPCIWMT